MLHQRQWMYVYLQHPSERVWGPFITLPSCWAKIMPALLSSSPTQSQSLRGYPVGEVNAFILPAAVLVTQDLQNVPPVFTHVFTIPRFTERWVSDRRQLRKQITTVCLQPTRTQRPTPAGLFSLTLAAWVLWPHATFHDEREKQS